jgi:hypothetical protein
MSRLQVPDEHRRAVGRGKVLLTTLNPRWKGAGFGEALITIWEVQYEEVV